MKKKLLLLISLAIASVMTAVAQEVENKSNREPHAAVQVSFFPPLSTNGFKSGQYTNHFSLNLLGGLSRNEIGVAFGGWTNVILNDAYGAQFAGLINYVGNEGRGVQFAGLGAINLGEFRGAQFGGLFNVARDMRGVQFGGLFNVARDVRGVQFGGLFNVARDVRGVQFGGLVNVARDVRGVQFGGLVNVAKEVRGVQFAGLVNVAKKSDFPIGLVNIIKEGEMALGVGYNEIGNISLNFRSGGRVLYGILGVGFNHKDPNSEDALSITAGYGAHINILPWLRINNEVTIENLDMINSYQTSFKAGYALLPTFRFWDHLEVFGGPSINYMRSGDTDLHGLFMKNPLWEKRRGDRLQQLFVGWQVGVQWVF